ncbi:MAG: 3-deoxy-manno-octulosonate cytidylyltransferase [Candidatus Omnitrophica bacterium]|nr:3-deoxy-manno-octulosonate cytidylyltransferase [Candidatus Omnitrophota bacterium]MDD5430366.1 3-deoxy-manno-octulosonate cytidylyltransferase [Candidatus Omnitrophota bacterium]
MAKTIAIIPARMASVRFPGKPLVKICGLPMIEHVRRRVALCDKLDEVIVATCDKEIKRVVEGYGGKAVMTADTYERCTDRIAEAARSFDIDIVVNVQGDEPLVMPGMIEKAILPLEKEQSLSCVNLVSEILNDEEFNDPNAPKVVTDIEGNILYISREAIPSVKKYNGPGYLRLKQLGIISFRSKFLQLFTKLKPTPLEQVESVDMMRAIEHGYKVRAVVIEGRMIGVDCPRDVERVEEAFKSDKLISHYR